MSIIKNEDRKLIEKFINGVITSNSFVEVNFEEDEILQYRTFHGYEEDVQDSVNLWLRRNLGFVFDLKRMIYPYSNGMCSLLLIVFEFKTEDLDEIIDEESIHARYRRTTFDEIRNKKTITNSLTKKEKQL